ncbi:hypothetical protein [Brevundimonas sp.]|uniref:hypothetical protein n=1 Tax=Brevundimonas sp. TaxID=1871086 RepID=UPI00356901FC
MGTISTASGLVEYQWASDVDFEGIRLEVLADDGNVIFDVSVPEQGAITVNTFSGEVSASLIASAVAVAEARK